MYMGSRAPHSLICLSLFCCTFTFIYCAGAAENNLRKHKKMGGRVLS